MKYRELIDNGYLFQPVALEVHCSSGESSETFITCLCKMHCRSHDNQQAGSFLKQRISMALQIGNADCVLGTVSDRNAFEEIYYIWFFLNKILYILAASKISTSRLEGFWTFRQNMAADVSANKNMPKRLRLKTFAETFGMICGAYPVYARSPSPSQRPASTTIASRSPFPLGLFSCSTLLSKMGNISGPKGQWSTRGNGDIPEARFMLCIIPTITVLAIFFNSRFLKLVFYKLDGTSL